MKPRRKRTLSCGIAVIVAVSIVMVWAAHTFLFAHSPSRSPAKTAVVDKRPQFRAERVREPARLPEGANDQSHRSNASIDGAVTSIVGTQGGDTHDKRTDAPFSFYGNSAQTSYAALAYLLIISNEDFMDGALVLGASLRTNSDYLRNGTADLAIIITQGRVSDRSKERLRREGRFNQIFEVPSLAKRAPGAYWKDTFDKIYMFNLTMYEKIVFMDADMINIRSMDVLFAKDFGDPTFVGAIGFRGGSEGPYFQTGMMVIRPTKVMFDRIYERFESGVPPRGSQYNHGMNGRDGVLLRDVFGNNFKILDNKYSRNLNPRWVIPDYVISLHLRGKIKPWFDKALPNLDPELGKKEFGHPYLLFWQLYEELIHKNSEYYELAVAGKELPEPYGGKLAATGVSPLTHAWMMRYSTREYVQLLSDVDRTRRNRTLPGLRYITGRYNQSCTEVCAESRLGCSVEALSFSGPQDCDVLRQAFHGECKKCELGVYWKPHPGSDYPALDNFKGEKICKFNLLYDERGRPNCTAKYAQSKRYCPCVPQP